MSQRTEVQDQLRQLQETLKTERDRDEAQAEVAGATPEQRLAQADSRNKAISNTMAGVMRNVSSLRDNWALQRLQNRHGTTGLKLGMQDTLANLYNQWAGNLSTASAGAIQAGGHMLGYGLSNLDGTSLTNTNTNSNNGQSNENSPGYYDGEHYDPHHGGN